MPTVAEDDRESVLADLRRLAQERAGLRDAVERKNAEIRSLVIYARDVGVPVHEIAGEIGVSRSAIYKAKHIRKP